MMPIRQLKTPLGAVVQPMLAAVRSQPSRYRMLYCTMISGLSHVGMPLVVGLAVCAEPLLDVLLGPAWTPAARIFQFLALAGVVQMVTGTVGWLPITNGHAGRYARFSTAVGGFTLLSFAVGLPWGAEGVAAAYAAGQALIALPAFWYCSRGTAVTVGDIVSAMIPPLVSATVVGVAMLAVTVPISGFASWQVLLAGIAAGAGTWALVLLVWPRARREVHALVSVMRSGKRRRTP
jgi:PST family polysaccharide transporter